MLILQIVLLQKKNTHLIELQNMGMKNRAFT